MKIPSIPKIVFVALIIIFLAGCDDQGREIISATASPPPNPTITASIASITPTQVVPSATSSPTAAPTRMAIQPTLTPFPTLASQEAKVFTMNLIEKPTCRLPCLWGIEPGVTTPEEALQFFQSFSWEIDQIGPLRFKGHWVSSYSISFEDENVLDGLRLDVQDGQIIQLLTQTYSRRSEYMLSNLLSEYGKPDRVYILTSSNPPVRPIPFYLIVFYESQRIIARYDYPAVLKGDTVETCQLTKGPMLLTWSSTDNWTESEITDLLGPGIEYVKPLEEVTDLSIDTFYEKFKTYSENNCIKSDVEYWN